MIAAFTANSAKRYSCSTSSMFTITPSAVIMSPGTTTSSVSSSVLATVPASPVSWLGAISDGAIADSPGPPTGSPPTSTVAKSVPSSTMVAALISKSAAGTGTGTACRLRKPRRLPEEVGPGAGRGMVFVSVQTTAILLFVRSAQKVLIFPENGQSSVPVPPSRDSQQLFVNLSGTQSALVSAKQTVHVFRPQV